MTRLASLTLALLLACGSAVAADKQDEDVSHLPEAREAFESRQKDLVTLARHLGALHRLHQVCGGYDPQRYRKRLQQLIPLEAPMGRTRLDMTAAFNAAYRDMSRLYLGCSGGAWGARAREARAALEVVDRLYRPFR